MMRHLANTLLLFAFSASAALAQDGRAIRVALAPQAGGPEHVRAGEPVTVSVRAQDPASGFALTGLTPALWLLPLARDADDEDCERWVNRLAGAAAPPRGGVDVNGFDLIQATSDGRLALVDPLLNLASANLKGILSLGAVPHAWALEPGARVLALATPGDRRLRRIDLASFREIDAIALGTEPSAIVQSADTLWLGLSDGTLMAGPAATPRALGTGAVRLSPTSIGVLAIAESGEGAFLRADEASSFALGETIGALGYSLLADSGYALDAQGRQLLIVPQDSPGTVRRIDLPRAMRTLSVSPDGRWVALVADNGMLVSILDAAQDRIRWSIEVRDRIIAADFSDAFLYLMHARQGGASRVVFDPQGGPPGVVTIAAGSSAAGEQQAGALPLLARIPSAGILLASSRDHQGFMINDDNAQAAMSSLPLRAGAPAGILLRYRGLEAAPQERGLYRANITLPRGGEYLAVVRTERPALAHCARVSVAPAPGEPAPVAEAAEPQPIERRLLADTRDEGGARVLDFSITGSPQPALLGASLIGDRWQRSPRDIRRTPHGYRMRIDDAIAPFTLFVRYRDASGSGERVLAARIDEATGNGVRSGAR